MTRETRAAKIREILTANGNLDRLDAVLAQPEIVKQLLALYPEAAVRVS